MCVSLCVFAHPCSDILGENHFAIINCPKLTSWCRCSAEKNIIPPPPLSHLSSPVSPPPYSHKQWWQKTDCAAGERKPQINSVHIERTHHAPRPANVVPTEWPEAKKKNAGETLYSATVSHSLSPRPPSLFVSLTHFFEGRVNKSRSLERKLVEKWTGSHHKKRGREEFNGGLE